MKILLVAATRAELDPLYSYFKLPQQNYVQTDLFDLLITGVGMTATAFALGRYLDKKYQLVLNLGIAGSFDLSIPLGETLNVVKDEFSELGAEDGDGFLDLEMLGLGKKNYEARHHLLSKVLKELKEVNGITVNRVHGNDKQIAEVIVRCNPTTESMEGAAVFYACEQLLIPCLQVRSVSNYVERRNRENWQIGLAVRRLNEWAIRFLTNE